MHKNTVCVKRIKLTLCSLIFLSTFNISYSQVINSNWQWLHPKPQGNRLRWCKMWDANTWYMAGNYRTFMKTTDGGLSWIINNKAGRSVNGEFGEILDAHFFNQNTGILVGDFGSVTKTTNGGNTFDTVPGLFINSVNWRSLFFLNNSTGYIAGQNGNGGKLAKTTDGGNSWQFVESVIPLRFRDLFTINDTLILICDELGNIERSTDGGANWSIISTGSSADLYKIGFINKDSGFVCGSPNVIRLTTNSGLNWININNGLPSSSFLDLDYKLSGQNTEVYLTGDARYIYKTTNLGTSWDTIGFWGAGQNYMGPEQDYLSTDIANGDTLLTVGKQGLINKRSGTSNSVLYTNFVKFAGPINDIWIESSNGKIWAVGRPSDLGIIFDQVIYSSNGGSTWTTQNCGNTSDIYTSVQMLNSNTGYIVSTTGTIRRTVNSGASWDLITSPATGNLQKVEFVNESTGWIFGTGGTFGIIYKTTDGADSWFEQTATGMAGSIFSSDMLDENTGWIVGGGGKVSKTTDGGLNWIGQEPNISGGRWIINIKMLDANTGYLAGNENARKTTNGGVNWNILEVPLSGSYQFNGMDFINPDIGMMLYHDGTLKTTNGGVSWILDYTGASAGNIGGEGFPRLKMVSVDTTAFATGFFSSVLKYSPQSPIGIIEWQTGVPKEYMLYENYPNPFNPATTIKFAIPKQGRVTLKVYDIAGREVRTILNDLELNPGTVKHTFDGTNLASGVYFYSLYVNNALIETKKMILIK